MTVRRQPKPRTLTNIRKDAPEQDRNSEALAASPTVTPRATTTRYIQPRLVPATLEELGIACGKYREAAIADAKWSAITVWFFREGAGPLSRALGNACRVICACTFADRLRLGFPRLMDIVHTRPLASPEDQTWGEEIMATWEEAGRPHLKSAIDGTYKYIMAYQREYPNTDRTYN